MAVTDSELAAAKAYMRIDGSDDDAVVAALLESAKVYLTAAGVPTAEDAQYRMMLWGLTLWYYDKRDAQDGQLAEMPSGLRQAINQRKLIDPYKST